MNVLVPLRQIKKVGARETQNIVSLEVSKEHSTKLLKVGILFSGGPAPGGHNVVAGLYHALKELNPNNSLSGYLGGPQGLLDGKFIEITSSLVDDFFNLGGFHMLGSGRTKIETDEDFQKAMQVCNNHRLNALVFVGGDDTNTNAALLDEYLKKHGQHCVIIGVPKTIDGDLKSSEIEISFGFDTACKVYSEMIGNICFDAVSSRKYWHFIKLMGRKASHVTLECALQTHPNLTFISEEVEEKNESLSDIISTVADTVMKRAQDGKNYGVCLIPEGLIEFVPEFKSLITALNRVLAEGRSTEHLPSGQKELFDTLPDAIQCQLLQDRDPHGNVQVSKIETEKLVYEMVDQELKKRAFKGKFNPIAHFFGYEGRCSHPSLFDGVYCYNLGYVSAALIQNEKSGYMAGIKNLDQSVEKWQPIGVKISKMLIDEERKGKIKKVIEKAVVKLKDPAFEEFKKSRADWQIHDCYQSPGPIQFEGTKKAAITKTLALERAGQK